MLYGEINRQRLKIINEHVVADTIDYLEARFAFSEDWDGLEKWAHFAKDGEVYDIRLTDDCIRKEDHLNLSAGIWKVYLHGNEFSGGKVIERITTNAAILKVEPTGTLDGEPFPEMPASVTEQILARLEDVEQNGGGSGGQQVVIDDTLTKPGYAADAKAVGEKINQLSEAIGDLASITTKEDAEILRGICESSKYISADGTITLGGGAADKIETIEVAENTTVLIRASAGWGNCYYAFYDKNDTLIEKNNAPKDGAYQLQDYETLVPVGAVKIVVSQFGSTYEPSGITRYGGIVPNTGDLGEKVKSILNHFEESFLSVGTWEINNYIPADGIPKATQSPTYMVNSVPVKEGEKYIVTVCANWGGCLYSILDSDGNVLIKEGSENVAALEHLDDLEIIIPKGAKTLALSSNVTYTTRKCVKYDGYITTEVRLWHGKKWVVVGDSLTESNNATAKGYYDYIAEKTGITVVNMGLSGSGYARKADTSQAFYQRILNIPTDCDVVTIFGSFNDLGAGLELGNANDNGTETLAGCINTTIDNLYTVYPLANLGIVSPTPWDTTKPTTSGNAYDYVELLKEICELRSIPFLDLWRRSGLRPWEESYREIAYSKDNGSGTHPDETGHFVIAPKFKAFLEELLL